MRLLMVDDSPDDALFVEHALRQSGLGQWFRAVDCGEDAIEYLGGKGKYRDRAKYPFPTVVLLDLKMPGLDGFNVLEWLKSHEHCRVTPTIVFTSSAIHDDVIHAYALGANAYMVKPCSLAEMRRKIETINMFWSECEVPITSPDHICA